MNSGPNEIATGQTESETESEKTASGICQSSNKAFRTGEQLEYKVWYNWGALWIGAGKIEFSLTQERLDDKWVFHASTLGRTLNSYDPIYKVRDYYDTWFDTESLLPVKFSRKINEGGYVFSRDYTFDRDSQRVYSRYERKGVVKESVIDQQTECTHDLLSVIYALRSINMDDYEPGSRIPIDMVVDGKYYNLFLYFEAREKKKTRLGKFDCLLIRPQLLEGSYFKNSYDMKIWVSDDGNHVPLRIESDLVVGTVKADLIDYTGLLYPLSKK